MKKGKKSEKLLLEQIVDAGRTLLQNQRGLGIGQLIALIRKQLTMSQRALAKRSGVPQSTISKIESEYLQPNVSTLHKILSSLGCNLLITAVPRISFEEIRQRQATTKAKKRVEYLQGTMSLEKQTPNKNLLKEMIAEETKKLLESSSPDLWGTGL